MKKQIVQVMVIMMFLIFVQPEDSLTATSVINTVVTANSITEIEIGENSQAVAGGISISGNKISRGTPTKDTGIVGTENRKLEKFDAVEINGFPGEIIVRIGNKCGIKVTADESVISQVNTEITNRTLFIGLKQSISTSETLLIDLGMEDIKLLRVRGVADVVLEGVNTDKLQLQISGSGSIKASGKVSTVDAKISGSGNLMLIDLVSKQCNVVVNGSGDAEVHATESLNVAIRGSGDVLYHGTPAKISKKILGSGDLNSAQ